MNHTDAESKRCWVKWSASIKPAHKKAICDKFGIPDYNTINGCSPAEIASEDMELFLETSRRGFYSIIHEKWCKNGGLFASISCQ